MLVSDVTLQYTQAALWCCAGNSLCPENTALLTQQGGTLLFQDEQTVFRQDDAGILKYTSIADLIAAISKLQQKTITSKSQV